MTDDARSSSPSDTQPQSSPAPGNTRPPSAPSGRGPTRSPRRSFVPADELSGSATVFAETSDRLVRHLFDVGLRLHNVRAVFEQPEVTPTQLEASRDTITEVLDDLDGLIREAGLAMIELARTRQSDVGSRQVDTAHDGRMPNRRGRLR